MHRDPTPRPNVATGTALGYVTVLLGLLLTALKTNPTTLEGWLVALQPLVAGVIAYVAPAYQKAWAALIGAGLIPLILMLYNISTGAVSLPGGEASRTPLTSVKHFSVLSGLTLSPAT